MASPITVTATLNDPSGTALQGNAFIRFRLRNFQGFVPQIQTTSVLCETQIDAYPNSSGIVSQAIWGNNNISPINTFYTVEWWNQGRVTSSGNYIFDGNTNLNTASPVNTPPPSPGFEMVLENNGALNSSQTLLNLANTDGSVTITDVGGGTLQLSAGNVLGGNGAYFFGPGIISVGEMLSLTWSGVPANVTAGVLGPNVVTVYKFLLTSAYIISKVTTECTDNTAGQTATFGIYNAAGNKVLDGGSFTTLNSSGIQTNSITPVTLSAGEYWHAQACTYGSSGIHYPGIAVAGGAITNGYVFPFWVKNATRAATAANPLVAGVLPATLGTLTPFTPSNTNGDGVVCPLYE